jgi:uncharacterized protein YceK
MKYLLGLVLGVVCLSGCTSIENLSSTGDEKKVMSPQEITVFTPNGIVYVNSGF